MTVLWVEGVGVRGVRPRTAKELIGNSEGLKLEHPRS